MAYILNGVTLKNPDGFERQPIEIGGKNISITGRTTKDIHNRKEGFTLAYDFLTQAQISAILAIYNLETAVTFQVTETNLTIAATTVHVELGTRKYPRSGEDYREQIVLYLEEVS